MYQLIIFDETCLQATRYLSNCFMKKKYSCVVYLTKSYLLLSWLFLSNGNHLAYAQFKVTAEYNSPIPKFLRSEPLIIPIENQGTLIIKPDGKQPYNYVFTYLNLSLQLVWENKYTIPFVLNNSTLRLARNGNLYLLAFQDNSSVKLGLLRVNFTDGVVTLSEFRTNFPIELTYFNVLDDNIFLVGYYKLKLVVLELLSGETQTKVIPSFYERNLSIYEVEEDTLSNIMYFVVKDYKDCHTRIRPYSNLVGMLPTIPIENIGNTNYNNILIQPIDSKTKLMLGTFAHRCSNYPQGVFSKIIRLGESNSNQDPQYYRFVDYNNYYIHNPKKRERIQDAVERKRRKGKNHHVYDKVIFQNKIFKHQKEFVLTTEAYGASYRVLTANNYKSTTQIFDGFITRFATVTGFDETGEKVWDNTIKVNQVKNMVLKSTIEIGSLGDSVILAYQNANQIVSKLTHENLTVMPEFSQDYNTLFPNTYSNEEPIGFMHLHDNDYLFYGFYNSPFTLERILVLRKLTFELNGQNMQVIDFKKKKKNN